MTKEEYVSKQEEKVKEDIRSNKVLSNAMTFLCLAGISISIIGLYSEAIRYKFDLNTMTTKGSVLFLIPAIAFTALGIKSRITFSKDIKELKSKKIELPTDEEMADHNLKESLLEQASKIKSKVL